MRIIRIYVKFQKNREETGLPFWAEISYIDQKVVDYGTDGSIRADFVYGDQFSPLLAGDLKTSFAYISEYEALRYENNLPFYTPILELNVDTPILYFQNFE